MLVRPDVRGLFLLNTVAAEIWEAFKLHLSVGAIASRLEEIYGISYDLALSDVNRTIQDWRDSLLVARPPERLSDVPRLFEDNRYSAIDCRLHGKHFRILLTVGDLVDEIAPRLESLRVPPSPPDITIRLVEVDECVQLFLGEDFLEAAEDSAAARTILLQEMVRVSVTDGQFLAVLHAGACGFESRCVIFPASTHSGKTTLGAALMFSGLTLYADDSVCLDRETLRVAPAPFALMIREGSWPLISARLPAFDSLPTYNRYGQNVKFLPPTIQPDLAGAAASALVFSRWQASAETTITSLNTFEALMRLKDSGFWLAPDREGIRKFLDFLQSLPIYEMTYSDIDEAMAFVKQLVSK